jgi:predicted DNA-binding protein with PD1-like motif
VIVELEPGRRLLDTIDTAAKTAGVNSAQAEVLADTLDSVPYCLPAVCSEGRTAATFSERHTARGPVSIVGGGVTFGRRDGAPFMHCHLAWLDAVGALRAGHLWPETTIGSVPVRAVLYPLPGLHSVNADDTETGLPVFAPVPAGPCRSLSDTRGAEFGRTSSCPA